MEKIVLSILFFSPVWTVLTCRTFSSSSSSTHSKHSHFLQKHKGKTSLSIGMMMMQCWNEKSFFKISVPVLQLLSRLGINISVVLFTTGNTFRIITLKGFNVEYVSERTTVWSSNTFDTDVEFSTVSWMSVSRVVTRLFHLWWIRTYESFCYFCSISKRRARNEQKKKRGRKKTKISEKCKQFRLWHISKQRLRSQTEWKSR